MTTGHLPPDRPALLSTRPKLYLSARISPDAHAWNDAVTGTLDDHFEVFRPQDNNPCDVPHQELERHIFELDLAAMVRSDIGLLLAPYGRDCAWEAGWYAGAGKPLVAYVERETEWLRDWMVKGGVAAVVTPHSPLHDRLRADPIVGRRCQHIRHRSGLAKTLLGILRGWVPKRLEHASDGRMVAELRAAGAA